MTTLKTIGFDIGATKTAWAIVDTEGEVSSSGKFVTPNEREALIKELVACITKARKTETIAAVGIGAAGTVSANHRDVVVCQNIPDLSHFQLVSTLEKEVELPVVLDNDARCALVGEAWQGTARETTSAVLITIGTGVGGAVMQKGRVLPHPTDVNQEISHLVADPADLFPGQSGRGTVESMLGGRSLEARFGVSVAELAKGTAAGKEDDVEIFTTISYYFIQCIRAIYDVFHCKMIIVGGQAADELELYLRESPPCPVIPAQLGELAGAIGAARLALDVAEARDEEQAEWTHFEEMDTEG